jgi:hypothetical protein
MMHWLAAARVAGKPLSVTEWNVERFPVPDRHLVPLYIAASARLHGWEAVMQYAYAQRALDGPGTPSNWHAFNDPGLLATLPAAALLYRRGDVAASSTVYAFAPDPTQLFHGALSPRNSAALRTAAERGKIVIALPRTRELPWLDAVAPPKGARVINDPAEMLVVADAAAVSSDTGQLRRDWELGLYTIDTPSTQAATGWIGDKLIRLSDIEVTAGTRSATVAVQSLDANPIRTARALLVSIGARAQPRSTHELPFHVEPVRGRLRIAAPRGLRLYGRFSDAQAERRLPMSYSDGWYSIDLAHFRGTYWAVMR